MGDGEETRRLGVDDHFSGVPPTPPFLQKCPDWEETTISYENFVLRRGTIQPPTFQLSVAIEKGSFRLIPEGLIPNLLHLPSAPHSPCHMHTTHHTYTHILSHTHNPMDTGPLDTGRYSGLQGELWGL